MDFFRGYVKEDVDAFIVHCLVAYFDHNPFAVQKVHVVATQRQQLMSCSVAEVHIGLVAYILDGDVDFFAFAQCVIDFTVI